MEKDYDEGGRRTLQDARYLLGRGRVGRGVSSDTFHWHTGNLQSWESIRNENISNFIDGLGTCDVLDCRGHEKNVDGGANSR
jgi:hypothetical protein